MKIRIATRALAGLDGGGTNRVASSLEEAEYSVLIPWVEIDGVRTSDVIAAKVEMGLDHSTHVTLKIAAAAEMVLVDEHGRELE